MHSLLGERYLKRFAGNLFNRRKPPAYILLEEQKPQPEKKEENGEAGQEDGLPPSQASDDKDQSGQKKD